VSWTTTDGGRDLITDTRYPDDGLTVVVLTNLGSADAHLIADKVAATTCEAAGEHAVSNRS